MEIIEEQLSKYGHGGLAKMEGTWRNPSSGDPKVSPSKSNPSDFDIDPIICTLEALETREIIQQNLLELVR